jgi:hypothetical protein
MLLWLGLLGIVITFLVIYTAVRMAVTDALRITLRDEFLAPAPDPLPFQLDDGDDEMDEGFASA